MKKIFAIAVCLCLLFTNTVLADTTVTPEKEYELWTQSPYVTCGFTNADMRIYKAYDMDVLELYPLSEVGDRYYLAVCPDQNSDGGYSGKTKTTDFYFYTIYATDDGFIVLSEASASNEYYWDRGYSFANIANQINTAYYTSNNSEVPLYILNPSGKYTNSNYSEYDEYFFITNSGKIYKMSEYVDSSTEGYPYIKDNILYRGQNKYYKSSSYYFYYLSDGSTKASNSKPIFFKNGSITYGTEEKIAVSEMTVANGYNMYTDGFASGAMPEYAKIPGATNLYYTTQYIAEYNTTESAFKYNIKVCIYKLTGKNMSLQNIQTITTNNTSMSSFTCKSLASLDESYYTSNGYAAPKVLIGEYGIITLDGKVFPISLNSAIYLNYYHIGAYNNHLAVVRSYTGSDYIYHKNPATGSNCYWQIINEITFDISGSMSLTADLELPISTTANTGQNGYFSAYRTWDNPSFTTISNIAVNTWWNRGLTNVFPDGRTVSAGWMGMGNGLAELWYDIYNEDGTLRATGPTGYSTYFSSSFDRYDMSAYTVNNSKFLVCIADIGRTFLLEYYRVAVVSENDEGEISGKAVLGKKNINPPSGADTEVIQSTIDFGQNELPIGYNIKNNVIDSDKLDVDLREQVNAIRLNDVVILKKSTYQSGFQNTGITLSTYSTYDYSLGSSYVRFYTNGQYFRWYCYSPNNLSTGTYEKTFTVGDKTIYVTIKVIQPPTNEGSTTVVF